jgi:hypothetical protein
MKKGGGVGRPLSHTPRFRSGVVLYQSRSVRRALQLLVITTGLAAVRRPHLSRADFEPRARRHGAAAFERHWGIALHTRTRKNVSRPWVSSLSHYDKAATATGRRAAGARASGRCVKAEGRMGGRRGGCPHRLRRYVALHHVPRGSETRTISGSSSLAGSGRGAWRRGARSVVQ